MPLLYQSCSLTYASAISSGVTPEQGLVQADSQWSNPVPAEPLFEPEPVFEPAIGPPDGPATFGAETFGTGILKLPLGLLTFGALGFTAGLGAAAGAFGTPCGVGGFVVFCGAHGIWNDCCCFLGAAFLGC